MIVLIAAVAENGVIGKDGRIPWHIPGEQRRFCELTMGKAVVIGRRSYEEIGRPLPGRLTVVVSGTRRFEGEGLCTAQSLEEALALAGEREVCIAGGARLYREALPLAERLYLTEIGAAFEGDTFFPEFDRSLFVRTVEREVQGEIPYRYVTWRRR